MRADSSRQAGLGGGRQGLGSPLKWGRSVFTGGLLLPLLPACLQFVTMHQLIDWIRNPIPASEMKAKFNVGCKAGGAGSIAAASLDGSPASPAEVAPAPSEEAFAPEAAPAVAPAAEPSPSAAAPVGNPPAMVTPSPTPSPSRTATTPTPAPTAAPSSAAGAAAPATLAGALLAVLALALLL